MEAEVAVESKISSFFSMIGFPVSGSHRGFCVSEAGPFANQDMK